MSILPHDTIRNSYIEQAQLAQAHRWIAAVQGCGHTAPVAHLLAPATYVEVDGQRLPDQKGGLPNLQQIQVKGLDASKVAQGHDLHIEASALRFATDLGSAYQAGVALGFTSEDPLMPLITKVSITKTSTTKTSVTGNTATAAANEEPEAWAPHRLLALKHRWHTLGECPMKAAPPYKDVITANFVMDWRTGSVNSYEELAAWLQNSAASMAAARHDIEQFHFTKLGANLYQPVFVFSWSGISLKGKSMQATSRHTWRVVDDQSAPYPRLDRMDIEFLEPFHEAG